jgi:hypothetical protein
VFLRIDQLDSAREWPLPLSNAVDAYNCGQRPNHGPTEENPLIDWENPGRTNWTKQVAKFFATDFGRQWKNGGFPPSLEEPARNVVIDAFLGHIDYLKGKYRGDVLVDSEDERETRLARSRKLQRGRALSRRKQVR